MTDSLLRNTMTRELLRYAAGRAMFCPACDVILDASRTVLITPRDDGRAAVLCADCYDSMRADLPSIDEAALLARCEIDDGRNLA